MDRCGQGPKGKKRAVSLACERGRHAKSPREFTSGLGARWVIEARGPRQWIVDGFTSGKSLWPVVGGTPLNLWEVLQEGAETASSEGSENTPPTEGVLDAETAGISELREVGLYRHPVRSEACRWCRRRS